MIVQIESIFDASPNRVWQELLSPLSLIEVASPMAKIVPLPGEGFPRAWQEGHTYRCKSFLYGVIPVGMRTIYLERVDAATHEIQSRERDSLIRKWDHLISIHPHGDGQSKYTDRVDIDAGILTAPVWAWATLFYKHRQRRWRERLVKRESSPPRD